MMDEQTFGPRNRRSDYIPNAPVEGAPLFRWPVQRVKLIRWLPHYFLA
jgi:hypothetical protein